MKKILVLLLLAIVAVYVTGRVTLGAHGAMSFVVAMENLTNEGKSDQVCAMFHDDLEVSISDHTTRAPREVEGGKEELCELTRESVAALRSVPMRMSVEWNDFEVTRSWLHPWTSEVSYTEDRSMTIRGANLRINTTSDNTITLVQTFSGVKLRKLAAEAWVAE